MLRSWIPGALLGLLGTVFPLGALPAAADDGPRHGAVVLTLHFAASAARTIAAFGPLAEAQWSPDFRPDFVFPQPPLDVAGAVFRTPDGKVWLLHDFDTAGGFVQYVISGPSEMVTLSIHATPEAPGTTVTMTYDITALDDRGAAHLAKVRAHAAAMSAGMQDAIGAYLAKPAS
jgi:hypothetical protein